MRELIYNLPPYFCYIFAFIILYGAYRLGYFLATLSKINDNTRSTYNTFEAGILGVLGFFLSISFSIESSQFENRRLRLIEEGNAIGTAYLRLSYFNNKDSQNIKLLFLRYINAQIFEHESKLEDIKVKLKETSELQTILWNEINILKYKIPDIYGASIIEALNTMFDSTAAKKTVMTTHIPNSIATTLLISCILAMITIGYIAKLEEDTNPFFPIIVCMLISSIFIVILDLDTPLYGYIISKQDALITTREMIISNIESSKSH